MSRKLNRSLITLLFLFGSISLANAQSGAGSQSSVNPGSSGWTFVQDTPLTDCVGGQSSCSPSAGNIIPTTAGTVWIVRAHTGSANPVTIASVSGGGATWHLCPASSCHLTNSAFNDNQDLAYGIGGAAGTTNVTITLSGASAQYFGGNFMEILPPPGSTASFDTAGTRVSSSCTTCTGPNLTLTGTDAVIEVLSGTGASAWNSFSAPYITDIASDGIGLNITNGAGPTVTVPPSGGDITAIAFTSSLGTFTPPIAGPLSIVHYTTANFTCSHNCTITVPTTGTGNLLYLQAANIANSFISSVSGGGTWVVPASCNRGVFVSFNLSLSCAYVLSSTPASSVSVTMTGSGSNQLGVYEVSSSGGTFSVDAIASTQNAASFSPRGQALTLTGTNDVIFQALFEFGGSSGVNLYPYPLGGANFLLNEASTAARLNTSDGTAPTWTNNQNNATIVSGVAFMAVGGSTSPNPPTGLAVVVQ